MLSTNLLIILLLAGGAFGAHIDSNGTLNIVLDAFVFKTGRYYDAGATACVVEAGACPQAPIKNRAECVLTCQTLPALNTNNAQWHKACGKEFGMHSLRRAATCVVIEIFDDYTNSTPSWLGATSFEVNTYLGQHKSNQVAKINVLNGKKAMLGELSLSLLWTSNGCADVYNIGWLNLVVGVFACLSVIILN